MSRPHVDRLFDGVKMLASGNSSFDQILWDPARNVLSFRRAGYTEFVNLWLDSGKDDWEEHVVETNGGPAADSVLLWSFE